MGWPFFYAASRLQHASRNMRHAKIKNGLTTEFTEGGVNCWGGAFPQTRDEPFCRAADA